MAIIGSVVDLQQPVGRVLSAPFKHKPPETVPQSPAVLSDNDWQVLEKLGLPPEKWDTLHVLLATYNQSHIYDVFSVQVSKPGMELSRSYVLEQIEYLLMHSAKKNAGKNARCTVLYQLIHRFYCSCYSLLWEW